MDIVSTKELLVIIVIGICVMSIAYYFIDEKEFF